MGGGGSRCRRWRMGGDHRQGDRQHGRPRGGDRRPRDSRWPGFPRRPPARRRLARSLRRRRLRGGERPARPGPVSWPRQRSSAGGVGAGRRPAAAGGCLARRAGRRLEPRVAPRRHGDSRPPAAGPRPPEPEAAGWCGPRDRPGDSAARPGARRASAGDWQSVVRELASILAVAHHADASGDERAVAAADVWCRLAAARASGRRLAADDLQAIAAVGAGA